MVRRKHDRFDHTSGGVVVIDRRIGGLGGLFSLSIPVDPALAAAAQAMARGADSGVAGGWALPPGFSAVLQPRSGTCAAAWYGGAGSRRRPADRCGGARRSALSGDRAQFLGHARATQSPCGPCARRDVTRGGFHDGEGREFAFLRDKPCPVQKRIVLATSTGEIAVRLITSLAARRIEVWVNEGDEIERGQRIGRILLGSTVVLELPATAKLLVRTGERVRAGETAVAEGLPPP